LTTLGIAIVLPAMTVPSKTSVDRRFSGIALPVIPSLIAVLLCLPVLSFPFLWDDFDFLGRSFQLRWNMLLPDPQTLYYRPLTREVYFGFLNLTGAHPFVGHCLNALCLAIAVWLVGQIASRISGPRAGFFAGAILATMGAFPTLVGWVCGIQDLLALTFILGAMLTELRGRRWLAAVLFIGALLSKETSATLLPALLLIGSFRDSRRADVLHRILVFGLVTVLWLAIHPAPRLIHAYVRNATTSAYHSPLSASQLTQFASGILAVLNVPLAKASPGDFRPLVPAILLSISALLAGLVLGRRILDESSPASLPGLSVLAAFMVLPPVLVTSFLLWSPYYSCIPSAGLALLAGPLLARMRPGKEWVPVLVYFGLGIWTRTVPLEVTTEPELRIGADAMSKVETGFKKLVPQFPNGSYAYVSIQVGGKSGLHNQLYRFQPIRVWYRNPSLYLLDPNRYRPGSRRDYLFWINQEFQVFEIELPSFLPRSSGPLPDLFAYEKTLRTFAMGRAAGGQVDEAVRILLTMPGRPSRVQIYDRRIAAALLIASGRKSDAAQLLVGVPLFERNDALDAVFSVLHEPIPGLDMDSATMEAFGVSPDDLAANRFLMEDNDDYGFRDAALRFARRVLLLAPGDTEAVRIYRTWLPSQNGPQITVPVPHVEQ